MWFFLSILSKNRNACNGKKLVSFILIWAIDRKIYVRMNRFKSNSRYIDHIIIYRYAESSWVQITNFLHVERTSFGFLSNLELQQGYSKLRPRKARPFGIITTSLSGQMIILKELEGSQCAPELCSTLPC